MRNCFSHYLVLVLALAGGSAVIAAQVHPATNTDAPSASQLQRAVPEQWTDPSLHGTPLPALTPLLGERAELPTYTRELWRVQWRDRDPIDLYVLKPRGVAHPPVVLFLYGFPSDTDRFHNDRWGELVTQHGFAAVGFVSALTGQRYHDQPWREWFVSQLPQALGATSHDVSMVLDFLSRREDLDAGRAGIFGQGSGATIALLAAASDPRLAAIDALDPWGDWPVWLKDSPVVKAGLLPAELVRYGSAEFQQQLTTLDPLHCLPALQTGRVRLQQTAFDLDTPTAAQRALAAALPAGAAQVRYATEDEYRAAGAADGRSLAWLAGKLRAQGLPAEPVSTPSAKE